MGAVRPGFQHSADSMAAPDSAVVQGMSIWPSGGGGGLCATGIGPDQVFMWFNIGRAVGLDMFCCRDWVVCGMEDEAETVDPWGHKSLLIWAGGG